eukprot:5000390-Prymnesium_polylepis.1
MPLTVFFDLVRWDAAKSQVPRPKYMLQRPTRRARDGSFAYASDTFARLPLAAVGSLAAGAPAFAADADSSPSVDAHAISMAPCSDTPPLCAASRTGGRIPSTSSAIPAVATAMPRTHNVYEPSTSNEAPTRSGPMAVDPTLSVLRQPLIAPRWRRPKKMAGVPLKISAVVPLPSPCSTPKSAASAGLSTIPAGGASTQIPALANSRPTHSSTRGGMRSSRQPANAMLVARHSAQGT